MRLEITEQAEADLDEIGEYIALDNPSRAASYVAELEVHCRDILAFPRAFPLRISKGRRRRIAVHGRHVILFSVSGDVVTIHRVVDGATLK